MSKHALSDYVKHKVLLFNQNTQYIKMGVGHGFCPSTKK